MTFMAGQGIDDLVVCHERYLYRLANLRVLMVPRFLGGVMDAAGALR